METRQIYLKRILNQNALSYIALNTLPMRSGGPAPRFSPRMVTLVHATPSLGEIPVTNGG